MKRANTFEDALDLPPRLLTVAVVDPLDLREHPVESEGQNKRGIGRARISLSSNANLLQLALARTGSDGPGEPLVQFVHIAVCQIEVSLKFLQITAVLRQGGQPLEGDATIRDLVSRAKEEFSKVKQCLTNRSGVGVGHHIHTALQTVAMEIESDVRGEAPGLEAWSVDSRQSEFLCVGALEASFEGLEGVGA